MNKKYRKVIIAGNWKMNLLPSGVKPFVEELKGRLPAGMNGCSVVLCVPATHLAALAKEKVRRLCIGAQNVSEFEQGAHRRDQHGYDRRSRRKILHRRPQ